MLDGGNTDAIGSEQLRALYEDGRLTWTVTEAAKLLASPQPAPTRRLVGVSCRSA
jgi:hypothetical protein